MKSQFIGVLIHSIVLALGISGGLGVEMSENLFCSVVVVNSAFWWFAVFTNNNDEDWRRKAPNSNSILKFLIRFLLGTQVLASFAFGWFVIGGLHLFTTLLVFGRQLKAKNNINEESNE